MTESEFNTLPKCRHCGGKTRDGGYWRQIYPRVICCECGRKQSIRTAGGISRSHIAQENGAKRRVRSDSTSGYKGVHFKKDRGLWSAQVKKSGITYRLGYFTNPEAAAVAYNMQALKLYGDKAYQNDIYKCYDPCHYEYGTKGFSGLT